jgi:hypothetical protein
MGVFLGMQKSIPGRVQHAAVTAWLPDQEPVHCGLVADPTLMVV